MKPYRLPLAKRALIGHRSSIRPATVSMMLAATAVYGDLLKRVLPGTVALMTLYAISSALLAIIFITGRRDPRAGVPMISLLASALILTYVLQFCTGFDVNLLPALMMLIYVVIPLGFIAVIPRAYPEFDLRALALFTTIFMVPIHAVGFVQHFVDANFMVSTTYSETGGVIARNFLEGTDHFNRLPSLFASADRYAGVSAMQFLLTFLLLPSFTLRHRRSMLWRSMLWPAFSLLLAAGGMLIAGARSRIMIVGVALIVAGLVLLANLLGNRLSAVGRVVLVRAVMVAGLVLAGSLSIEGVRDRIAEFPVLYMLTQTLEKGDAQGRVQQGLEVSSMPDDVKFFGEGLGVSGDGRPSEFGVRAMWIEGGFFWTVIMLMIHAGIILLLARYLLRALMSGNAVLTLLLSAAGMLWLNSLMAGLTSTFELSIALLFFPLIAVAAILSATGAVGRPLADPRFNPDRRVH